MSVGAQIVVDQNLSPQEIVENHLLGEGVDIQNLTFNGASGTSVNPQIGTFSGGWESIGINQGIILATGEATVAEGPNDIPTAFAPIENELTEEPDLQQLVGPSVELNDVAVLEFDFVASGDTLRFSYVFASEEYNEHTCSPYNDAFGFFISGPGIEGDPIFLNNALNVAKIPGTNTPVAINTVNKGEAGEYGSNSICNSADANWQANSVHFNDNEGNTDPATTQFDGFTNVFQVAVPVECGGTYHIKIAIADAVDGKNDSAVFIKSESFSSQAPLTIEAEVVDPALGGQAVEGCSAYRFQLTRNDSTTSKVVYLESEFVQDNPDIFPDFPDSLIFYPAQGHLEWVLPIQHDGNAEGLRTFELSFLQTATCGLDTAETKLEMSLTDVDEMNVSYGDTVWFTCDESAQIEVDVSGGLEPYSINWADGQEGFDFELQPSEAVELEALVSDQCQIHQEELRIWVIPEPYDSLQVVLPEELEFNCVTPVLLTPFISGGRGDYSYAWTYEGEILSTESEYTGLLEGEGVLEFSVSDGCMGTVTIEVEANLMDNPVLVDLGGDRPGACDQELSLFPEVSGGFGSLDFLWYRNYIPVSTDQSYAFMPQETSFVVLEVSDQCGQVGYDTVFVTVDKPELVLDVVSDTSICKGSELQLIPTVTGGYGEYSFYWEERESYASSISIIPPRDVIYNLTVSDDCNQVVTASISIEVIELNAAFEFDYDSEFRPIKNLSGSGLNYYWLLPGGITSEEYEPYFDPSPGENQIVLLEVSHPTGCSDEYFDFYRPPLNLFVPNAFTPDGDGLNDVFTAKGSFVDEYDLWVFNRWGDLIFHSKNPAHGWDGSDPSGDFSGRSATYSYRLRAKGFDGQILDEKGSVQVLR